MDYDEDDEMEELTIKALKEAAEIFESRRIPYLIIAGVPDSSIAVSSYAFGKSKGAIAMIKQSFETVIRKIEEEQRKTKDQPLPDILRTPSTVEQLPGLLSAIQRYLTALLESPKEMVNSLLMFLEVASDKIPIKADLPRDILVNVTLVKESVDVIKDASNTKYINGVIGLVAETIKKLEEYTKDASG